MSVNRIRRELFFFILYGGLFVKKRYSSAGKCIGILWSFIVRTMSPLRGWLSWLGKHIQRSLSPYCLHCISLQHSSLRPRQMTSIASESIWSTMIAARQLSATYYTISTCLTDILHRYCDMISRENNDVSSSLLNNLYQTLFASSNLSINLSDQAKLLAEYANVLQTILKWVHLTFVPFDRLKTQGQPRSFSRVWCLLERTTEKKHILSEISLCCTWIICFCSYR